MKKITLFLFTICVAFLVFIKPTEAATSPSIYVDGKKVTVTSININGNNLVPVRAISEKLGLTVSWNQSNQHVQVSHPFRGWTLSHTAGSSYVHRFVNGYGDGGARYMNTASVIKDGVLYVPIRFFENMDAQVHWDGANNRIDVYSYELKMNQYLILASLAYNNLASYADNKTTLNNVFPDLSVGYKTTFNSVKDKLSIYTTYTHSDFASNEMLMKDWVVKTVLTKSDFSTTAEYNSYLESGFTGYAFRNKKTNEVVVSYRGTNFSSLSDWAANSTSLFNKSNKQKPYALQLFRKAITNADYVTVVGHSLGGNLAQGVASYYRYNYDKMVTFNAFGSGISTPSSEYEKAINYVVSTDPVKAARTHYGQVISYKIRTYQGSPTELSAHSLFNFYSYYFKPDSKYWTSGYGVPTTSSHPN